MIDMNAVNEEISRLEQDDLTYRIAEKLAVLYIIRKEAPSEAVSSRMIDESSEFISVAKTVPIEHFMKVIDEHMQAILTLYPKEYEYVLRKMKEVTD